MCAPMLFAQCNPKQATVGGKCWKCAKGTTKTGGRLECTLDFGHFSTSQECPVNKEDAERAEANKSTTKKSDKKKNRTNCDDPEVIMVESGDEPCDEEDLKKQIDHREAALAKDREKLRSRQEAAQGSGIKKKSIDETAALKKKADRKIIEELKAQLAAKKEVEAKGKGKRGPTTEEKMIKKLQEELSGKVEEPEEKDDPNDDLPQEQKATPPLTLTPEMLELFHKFQEAMEKRPQQHQQQASQSAETPPRKSKKADSEPWGGEGKALTRSEKSAATRKKNQEAKKKKELEAAIERSARDPKPQQMQPEEGERNVDPQGRNVFEGSDEEDDEGDQETPPARRGNSRRN